MAHHQVFHAFKGKTMKFVVVLLFLFALILSGCVSSAPDMASSPFPQDSAMVAEGQADLGIEVISLRQSAAGHMLDLRFRVVDPEKAKEFLWRNQKPYLMDDASGKVVPVPVGKIGAMRTVTQQPRTDVVYWVFFDNPGGFIHTGQTVTLIFGDYRVKGLVVQ